MVEEGEGNMKNQTKFLLTIFILLILCSSLSFGIMAVVPYVNYVSYEIGIVLTILKYAEYIVPSAIIILFLIIKRKSLHVKNILICLIVAVITFFAIAGIGLLIIQKTHSTEYTRYDGISRKTISFLGTEASFLNKNENEVKELKSIDPIFFGQIVRRCGEPGSVITKNDARNLAYDLVDFNSEIRCTIIINGIEISKELSEWDAFSIVKDTFSKDSDTSKYRIDYDDTNAIISQVSITKEEP